MDAMTWRKAKRSASNGGCVEVGQAATAPIVGIRDSKDRKRGALIVTPDAWQGFVAAIKAGRYEGRLDTARAH